MYVICCTLLFFLLLSALPCAGCALLQRSQCKQQASFCFIVSPRHSCIAEIKPHVLRSTFVFHVLGKGSSYEGCMDRCVTDLKKRIFRTTQCLFYFYIVWLAFNSQSNRFSFRYSKKGARFTKSHSNPMSPSHAPLFDTSTACHCRA